MQVVWQDNIDPDQMTYEVSGFYNFSLFTGGCPYRCCTQNFHDFSTIFGFPVILQLIYLPWAEHLVIIRIRNLL